MLAISHKEYYLPCKINCGDDVSWAIHRKGSSDILSSSHFTFTLINDCGPEKFDRFSFEYNGNSVKPTPRTLRVFGADVCALFTSHLANLEDISDIEFVNDNGVLSFRFRTV